MEKVKRKERPSSENENQSSMPADKRQRDKSDSSECDEVFEALNMAEDIGANIQQILTKLQKLDSLEALINKTLNKLEAVELQVNRLTIRVESVESKSKAVDETVGELKASVEFTSKAYDSLVSTQARDKEDSVKEIAELNKKIAYMEAYSRRENLLFEGIPEASTTDSEVQNEDTESVLRSFLSSTLKVEDPDAIEFQRVHRLGSKKSKQPRIIIARFLRYGDRQMIARRARKLRDDTLRIYPDYPKSIQESRKRQLPKLKAAKEAGKTAFFSQSKPDQLYVDGKFIPE